MPPRKALLCAILAVSRLFPAASRGCTKSSLFHSVLRPLLLPLPVEEYTHATPQAKCGLWGVTQGDFLITASVPFSCFLGPPRRLHVP